MPPIMASDMTALPALLLVGGGKMGAAMLAGWREWGLTEAMVVDPSPDAARLAGPDVKVVASPAALPAGFTPLAVVLAVKPQIAAESLPAYARFAANSAFISIIAGKTLKSVGFMLGAKAAIVRAMPNTAAAIRQSITVAVAGAHVSGTQRALAEILLNAIGQTAWVTDEALLDPVTAVSGGGPAYVFLLTELMEQAAREQGIPHELARVLARQTVIGAGALLAASEEDAANLRIAVTSPNGTTERALAVLRTGDAWPRLFSEAIAAATKRSQELSD